MQLRAAFVALAFLFGCASSPPRPQAEATPPAAPSRIDGPAARQLVAGGARLVDVRAPSFYEQGHIAGAINIPYPELAARAGSLGALTTPIVVYCRTGTTSARAAAELRMLGYQNVYDLGSYLNWGEGAPAPTPLPSAPGTPVGGVP